MKFSLQRAFIIARREYLTTVRRKAFVFSLLLTPTLMWITISLELAGGSDMRAHAHQARIVAVVDSSGVFANAERTYQYDSEADAGPTAGVRITTPKHDVVPVVIRPFATQKEALDSLDAGNVNTALVIPADFLKSGGIRRYEKDTRAFTGSADDGALRAWMSRALLAGSVDPVRIDRVQALRRTTDLFVKSRTGAYELKDDQRELWSFMLPFGLALMLGIAIITGGQYLMQGVAEEKETRILESLLCTVTPGDLMVGKLVGLGGAGLTMVGIWLALGLGAISPTLALLNIEFPPLMIALGFAYFLLGYLFYASLMTGIGAITNNLREAQQISITFTLLNFLPIYAIAKILNSPNSALTVGMSLFPPTAPATMMMRLCVSAITGAEVPLWQVAVSLGLLAVTALLALQISAKVFRIGLLLYGKTPNLPEIMRLVRQG